MRRRGTLIACGLAAAGALFGQLHPVLLFVIVVGFGGVSLPLDEADPRAQLARIHEATQELKESRQALGVG